MQGKHIHTLQDDGERWYYIILWEKLGIKVLQPHYKTQYKIVLVQTSKTSNIFCYLLDNAIIYNLLWRKDFEQETVSWKESKPVWSESIVEVTNRRVPK